MKRDPTRTRPGERMPREIDSEAGTVEWYEGDRNGRTYRHAIGYPGLMSERKNDGTWARWRIVRRIRRKPYDFTTGCYRLEAAKVIYVQFEADPEGFYQRLRIKRPKRWSVRFARRKYLAWMRKRDARPETIKQTRSMLGRFIRNVTCPPSNITVDMVEQHLISVGLECRPVTVRQHAKVIMSFLRWCARRGLMTPLDFAEMHLPRDEVPPDPRRRTLITEEGFEALLGVLPHQPHWAFVEHAMVLQWGAALRIGEVWRVSSTHLIEEGRTLWIPKSKSRRWDKKVPVTSARVRASAVWMADFNLSRPPPAYLERIYRLELKRMAAEAGLPEFTTHALRAAAITRWEREGCELTDVARWVGHRDTRTTRGYLSEERAARQLPEPVLD